jgi:hypothetical protein
MQLKILSDEPQKGSLEDAITAAERLKGMVGSLTFQNLMERAAKSALRNIVDGKSIEEREAAYQQLVGINAIEMEIQKVVDQGTRAAETLREAQDPES